MRGQRLARWRRSQAAGRALTSSEVDSILGQAESADPAALLNDRLFPIGRALMAHTWLAAALREEVPTFSEALGLAAPMLLPRQSQRLRSLASAANKAKHALLCYTGESLRDSNFVPKEELYAGGVGPMPYT